MTQQRLEVKTKMGNWKFQRQWPRRFKEVGRWKSMDKIKQVFGKKIMIIFSLIVIISFAGVATFGQQIWIGQKENTIEFEKCMEQAAFKNSNDKPDPIRKLSPEDLDRHFAIFDQILKDTGLPPIWNGKQLIPWKEYHKESIIFASQCHNKLGITKPQKQLRGTYSKAVWDPNSDIWQSSE